MAQPNYRFDKRQREIARKAKQEEKRLKKLARAAETEAGVGMNPDAALSSETPSTQPENAT